MDKIKNVAQRLGIITVKDMERYTALELIVLIANKMNEFKEILNDQNDKIQFLLNELSKKGYYHIKSFTCDDGVLVTGDGVHDDTTGIQKAIDTLNGDGIIVLTEGVYLISEFLQLKSNTTLIGLGKVVIKANSDFNKSVNNCMVDLSNSSNITIENIEFLADGSNRSKSIGHIMVLSNSHYCNFVDVIFSDTGNLTYDVASNLSSSSLVQLLGKETEDDLDEGVIGGSSYNTFRNCKFYQSKGASTSFAVRLKTNWSKVKEYDMNFCVAHNLFEDCIFDGNFYWNTFELAGTGTRFNTVANSTFSGVTMCGMDFDKGSSDNQSLNNKFINIRATPSEAVSSLTGRFAAQRINGIGSTTELQFGANNNVIQNSIFTNIFDPEGRVDSCCIMVGRCNRTIINNVTISNINNSKPFVGIFIDHLTENLDIIGCNIKGIQNGIRTNGAVVDTVKNITCKDNTLVCDNICILISNQNSVAGYCHIDNNKCYTINEEVDSCLSSNNFQHLTLSNNYISGNSNYPIRIKCDGATLFNNLCLQAKHSSYYIVGVDVLMMANKSINPKFNDIRKINDGEIVTTVRGDYNSFSI